MPSSQQKSIFLGTTVRPTRVYLISDFGSQVARAASELILRDKHCVCLLVDDTNLEKAAQLQAQYPETCIFHVLPTKNRTAIQCRLAVERCLSRWPQIDVLVNCPTGATIGALEEHDLEDLLGLLDSLVFSSATLIEAVLPVMRRQLAGHIITVTDVLGAMGSPGCSLLSAAMHALEGYCESVGIAEKDYNIRVSVVQTTVAVTLMSNPLSIAPQLLKYENSLAGEIREKVTAANVFPQSEFDDAVLAIVILSGESEPPSKIAAGPQAIQELRDRLQVMSGDLE